MTQKPQLSDRQERFVREYLISGNATDAYRKAGYSAKTADVAGPRLLGNVRIKARIARLTAERFKRLDIDADALIKRAETIINADPRELTAHHIGACRYCWGIDHEFQWKTPREFRQACEDADTKKRQRPDDAGGFGYRITDRPCANCPECSGLGIPYTAFADTRDLTPAAALLFEGVKEGKHGIEIITASKQAAFDLLAKHHGILVNKHEHTGKDGKPIEHDVKVKARVILVPAKAEAAVETRAIPKDGSE